MSNNGDIKPFWKAWRLLIPTLILKPSEHWYLFTGCLLQRFHFPGTLCIFVTVWWLLNATPSLLECRLALFMRKFFITSSIWYNLGLGSETAWFWSPALFIKCKGAKQHDNRLSGDRTMLELLPKTQAGSKPVAPGWKGLLGSTMGVYLNRWPCRERLQLPLPTAGWQAGCFYEVSRRTQRARGKYGGNLLRPCSFSIKWIEKKTMKRLCENYHPLSKWPVSIVQLMFSRLLYLRGEKKQNTRDFFQLLGFPGNGRRRKTAACIESSLRVKCFSAWCLWHHLTLPRRGALASFSGLASSRSEGGSRQQLSLVSPGDLQGQKLWRNVATKTLNLCLYWLERDFFFHNLWKHNVARKLRCECEFQTA